MSDLITRPVLRNAHARSVQLDTQAIAARLRQALGKAVVSIIVAKSPLTVDRWSTGKAHPDAGDDRLLRDAYHVLEVIAEVDADSVARAWFIGMNPQLDDAAPVEALAEGRARQVMAAARTFVNAG